MFGVPGRSRTPRRLQEAVRELSQEGLMYYNTLRIIWYDMRYYAINNDSHNKHVMNDMSYLLLYSVTI